MRVLRIVFGLAIVGALSVATACGNESCRSFCAELGCEETSAACDADGECACQGCAAYYEAYFRDGELVGTDVSCQELD